jgi:hypothetical protein
VRVSTSPSLGSGTGSSTISKSDSFGKPTGREANLTCLFIFVILYFFLGVTDLVNCCSPIWTFGNPHDHLIIVSLLARRNVDQFAGFSTAQAVLFH